jgi:high-affinity iron transporter
MLSLAILIACAGSDAPDAATVPDPTPAPNSAPVEAPKESHMDRMNRIKSGLQNTLGEAYAAPVPSLAAADSSAGGALYAQHCALCHGESGQGDGPAAAGLASSPSDHTDPFHARYYSDAGRMEIIRNGVADSAMPGFGTQLSDGDQLNLYAFVAGLRGPEPQHPGHESHEGHAH